MLDPKIFGKLTPKQVSVIKASSIHELAGYCEMCWAAKEAARGIVRIPLYESKTHWGLETLLEDHMDLVIEGLTEELKDREPIDKQELEYRNECLALWAMKCGAFLDASKLLGELKNN